MVREPVTPTVEAYIERVSDGTGGCRFAPVLCSKASTVQLPCLLSTDNARRSAPLPWWFLIVWTGPMRLSTQRRGRRVLRSCLVLFAVAKRISYRRAI